jgi:hypothetical protein
VLVCKNFAINVAAPKNATMTTPIMINLCVPVFLATELGFDAG